ncbi:unnamed protein product [Moneuplotes crassus]|uniref:Macrophage erythroblast attacher n=1 Tax=Euplotes crassus TaxID=5936 RepID=A0AAD1XIJ8_EUPCR|nr:unnamed protein product [Moneuplotes crassus]
MDSSFTQIVHERLSKSFRTSKRHIEKQIISQVNLTKNLKDFSHIKTTVHTIKQNVLKLRDEYKAMSDREDQLLRNLETRLEYLGHVQSHWEDKIVQNEYYEKMIWRLIVEYMMREGYVQSAKILIDEVGLEEFSDFEFYMEINAIVEALRRKKCQEAIEWCSLYKSKLSSSLEFELRMQEFIELVKIDSLKAVEYARDNFSGIGKDNLPKLQRIMGMLSHPTENLMKIPRYMELFSDEKWESLVDMFIEESCKIYSLTKTPMLMKCMSIGCCLLKTIFCSDDEFFNESCPTCSLSFRKICSEVPFVQKSHTSLICRISGKLMDENNPPLMLPNSHIYSEKALKEQAKENNGYVICPKTTTKYLFEKCTKVYIL